MLVELLVLGAAFGVARLAGKTARLRGSRLGVAEPLDPTLARNLAQYWPDATKPRRVRAEHLAHFLWAWGWRGEDLVRATRIVLGESGGKPWAVNSTLNRDKSVDRGLWQWNSRAWPGITADEALDPYASTRYAWDWYNRKGRTFTPGGKRGPWGVKLHPERDQEARQALRDAGHASEV